MKTTPIPYAPFIEILNGVESGDPDAKADEWHFRIDGRNGGLLCTSAEHAAEAAEQELFKEHQDVVDRYLQMFLKDGTTFLALQLIERRGFHAGIAQERERLGGVITTATETLNKAVGHRRSGF